MILTDYAWIAAGLIMVLFVLISTVAFFIAYHNIGKGDRK